MHMHMHMHMGGRRMQEAGPTSVDDVLARNGGELRDGDTFVAEFGAHVHDEEGRRMAEGDVAVATATGYYRVTSNFHFTNGK